MTDEQEIKEALLQMRVPADADRKASAIAAIEGASPGKKRRRWHAPLIAAAVVGGLVLTPPGQALVSDLVGVGDETEIAESNLRDPRLSAQQERIGPAIVTAKGTVPVVNEPFEILAWGARYIRDPKLPPDGGDPTQTGEIVSCMGAFYPEIGEQEVGSICVGPHQPPPRLHVLGFGGAVPGSDYGGQDREQPYQVIGDTALDLDRLVVTYTDSDGTKQEVEATLGTMDDEVLEQTGAEKPFSFFVALLPYDGAKRTPDADDPSATLASAKVIAYDAEGVAIATEDIGATYRRSLRDQSLNDARMEAHDDLMTTGAQLAICLEFGDRVPRPDLCTTAEAAGRGDPFIRSLGQQLQSQIRIEADTATVQLPGGVAPVVVELGPEQ